MNEGWLFLSRNLVKEDALFLYDATVFRCAIETLKFGLRRVSSQKFLLGCVEEKTLDVPSVLGCSRVSWNWILGGDESEPR